MFMPAAFSFARFDRLEAVMKLIRSVNWLEFSAGFFPTAFALGPVNAIDLGWERCRLVDGDYRKSISTDCRLPATSAWQCEHDQLASAQRSALRGRAGLQMA